MNLNTYGEKYELQWIDRFGTLWNAYIDVDGWGGSSSYITGSGDPIFVGYEMDDYSIFTPIKPSYCELNLIELVDDTFKELFLSDRKARLSIFKSAALYWQGWSIAEGYNSLYNLCPKPVKLTFVDGLTLLKTVKLPIDTLGGPDKYLIKDYFKLAFDNIGLENKIYEAFNISFSGLDLFTKFYIDSWRWYNNKEYANLYDILYDILFTFGCRLYQLNGNWRIDNISEIGRAHV